MIEQQLYNLLETLSALWREINNAIVGSGFSDQVLEPIQLFINDFTNFVCRIFNNNHEYTEFFRLSNFDNILTTILIILITIWVISILYKMFDIIINFFNETFSGKRKRKRGR